MVVALALTAAGPALADRAAAEGAPEDARGVTLDSIDRADDVAGRAEPTLAAKVGEGPRRVTRKERLAQLADVRPFPPPALRRRGDSRRQSCLCLVFCSRSVRCVVL